MAPDRDDPTDAVDARTIPSEDDRGKDVVDVEGQNIGIVTEVEGDTMYVDTHPSLTEQVMSRLGWSSEGGDSLPVSPEFVRRIEGRVVLDVQRDGEFQETTG